MLFRFRTNFSPKGNARMKNWILKILSLSIVFGTLSACHSTTTIVTDPYYHAWYNVYGSYCGNGYPTSGCNFYANGSKITMSGDPYYHSGVTLYNDFWTYTDSYGYRRSYSGFAWLSSTGILYDQSGNALNELEDDQAPMDLVSEVAAKEKTSREAVGRALAQKYALNEDTGVMISKTLQDWAKLGKDRSRTGADISDFSKRLYGVSADQAESAIEQSVLKGNSKAVEELNVDVAAHWGTSPEVSKQILKSWYKDEAAALGM
jgi:hypothetical protein